MEHHSVPGSVGNGNKDGAPEEGQDGRNASGESDGNIRISRKAEKVMKRDLLKQLVDQRNAEDEEKDDERRERKLQEKSAQSPSKASGQLSRLSTALRVLRGGVVLAILVLTAFAHLTALAPLALLLVRPFSLPLYRRFTFFMFGWWLSMYVFNLEVVNGTRVLFSGDSIPREERAIVICNHRTELDWIYIWCLAIRKGRLGAVKYALKSAARKYPLFGWAFHIMEFFFLERKWERDEATLKEKLATFTDRSAPFWFIIFPEGTDFSEEKRARANQFARNNGLPEVEHILLPKHRGLSTALAELRSSIDAVYDVTVAYKTPSPTFVEALLGTQPTHVYLDIQRHAAGKLSPDPGRVSSWLHATWQRKDRLLAGFYETGHFPGSAPPPLGSPLALRPLLGAANVIWWSTTSVAFLYWACCARWLQLYVVASWLFLTGCTYFGWLPPPLLQS